MTPTSYLELINAFKTLLQKKQDETFTAKIRYVTGLEKLQFAASQVRNEPLSPQLVESLKRESRVDGIPDRKCLPELHPSSLCPALYVLRDFKDVIYQSYAHFK